MLFLKITACVLALGTCDEKVYQAGFNTQSNTQDAVTAMYTCQLHRRNFVEGTARYDEKHGDTKEYELYADCVDSNDMKSIPKLPVVGAVYKKVCKGVDCSTSRIIEYYQESALNSCRNFNIAPKVNDYGETVSGWCEEYKKPAAKKTSVQGRRT